MSSYFKKFLATLKRFWINRFWTKPNNLWALKVACCIAILLIPFILLDLSYIGSTLSLGVVAMALSETDVHPRGKLKAILLTYISFVIAVTLVVLLKNNPLYFIVFLALFSFALTLIGGINPRLQGVTFGTLLISIYAMLGSGNGLPWYFYPVVMPLGGLFYGLVSLAISYRFPFRLLEEQISFGFTRLSEYVALKSKMFPSDKEQQEQLRNELALKNVEVTQKINQIKSDLYSFAEESSTKSLPNLNQFFNQWYVLQEIQRRAISSHEDYYILSKNTDNTELITGLGIMMKEISKALQKYAESILINVPYKIPVSLSWTSDALKELFKTHKEDAQYSTLQLLYVNIAKLESILKKLENPKALNVVHFSDLKNRQSTPTLKQLFDIKNPRFRHAIRLSLCFVFGYYIKMHFNLPKGEWILLTSLLVLQQSYVATRQRFFSRILGTFAGVILGISLAKLLPTMVGEILVLLGSVYAFFRWIRTNYTLSVVFVTIFVLESFNIQSNTGILMMLPRLEDTLIGAVLAFLSVRFLWPDWQYKQLPKKLKTALEKNKRYFESIYEHKTDYQTYLHNQRTAHNADNQLTSSWQGMRLEPKNKQKFLKSAYNLTYYNHSLLSYLSAFGAHYYNGTLSEEEIHYCEKISQLMQEILKDWDNRNFIEKDLLKASNLVKELNAAKEKKQFPSAVLLYNIAKICNEFLYETQEVLS